MINDEEILYIPTLRQALTVAQKLGYMFRDTLPMPKRYVNTDATEPKKILVIVYQKVAACDIIKEEQLCLLARAAQPADLETAKEEGQDARFS